MKIPFEDIVDTKQSEISENFTCSWGQYQNEAVKPVDEVI